MIWWASRKHHSLITFEIFLHFRLEIYFLWINPQGNFDKDHRSRADEVMPDWATQLHYWQASLKIYEEVLIIRMVYVVNQSTLLVKNQSWIQQIEITKSTNLMMTRWRPKKFSSLYSNKYVLLFKMHTLVQKLLQGKSNHLKHHDKPHVCLSSLFAKPSLAV